MATETRKPTAAIAPFGLRMQPELRAKIEAAAEAHGRSMNAEIIDRLEDSFVSAARGAAQIQAVADLMTGVIARVAADMRAEGRSPADFVNWMREFPEFAQFLPPGSVFRESSAHREGPEGAN